ncbi:MAG: type IV secretion system DNA-binding domain-containing protein [Pseudomonadota bacterium]
MKPKKLIRLARGGFLKRAKWLTTDDMTTHILVTGGIGSGKTSCILAELVRENVRAGATLLIFAGKATDADTFARFIQQGGGPAPLRLGSDPTLCFPLLEYLDRLGMSSPDIASVLKDAAAAMKQSGELGAESEDWQTRALDLITKTFILRRLVGPLSLMPIMRLLGRLPSLAASKRMKSVVIDEAGRPVPQDRVLQDGALPDGWRVEAVPNLMLSPEWAEMIAVAQDHEAFEVQEALHYMTHTWPLMNDRTATSITSQFIVLLSRLSQEPLLSLLAEDQTGLQTAVTPDTLFIEGQHVIIDVPTTSNPESGRAAQAMFQRAMRLAMVHRERSADGQIKGGLVVGIIDEFQQSVSDAKSLLELLQISREFKYGLVLATQNISNVVFRFGRDGADAILGLPETKVAARNTDMPTCKMIADAIGVEEREVESIRQDDDGRASTTVSLQERPKVRPEVISKLKKVEWTDRGRPQTETIVLHDGEEHWVLWDGLPRSWDRFFRSFWVYREKDRGIPAMAAFCLPMVLNLGPIIIDAPAPPQASPRVFRPDAGAAPDLSDCTREIVYTVQRGDTLGRIAAVHRVHFRRIAYVNALRRPDRIEIGDTLRIPDQPCRGGGATWRGPGGLRFSDTIQTWAAKVALGLLLAAVYLIVRQLNTLLGDRDRDRTRKDAPSPKEVA